MEQDSRKDIQKKANTAFILLGVLIIPIFIILFMVGLYITETRTKAQEKLKAEEFVEIVAWQDKETIAAQKRFDDYLSKDVHLMTTFLKNYVTEDGYTGPYVFSNGFVVELEGDTVAAPKGAPGGDLEISRELIESSLESGNVRTGSVSPNGTKVEKTGITGQDIDHIGRYVSFGKITDDLVYVQLTEKKQLTEYLKVYTSGRLVDTSTITKLFDGITFVTAEDNGDLELLEKYGTSRTSVDSVDLTSLGITSEMVTQGSIPDVKLDGQKYHCVSAKAAFKWQDRENVYLIQLIPVRNIKGKVFFQALITCLLLILFFVTLIVYAVSEQRLLVEGGLTEDNAGRYNPDRLRHRLFSAGLSGAVVVFLVSFLGQAVGQMHQQIRHGRDVMDILSEQLEELSQEQDDEMKAAEESWYLHFAQRIAAILERDPELATKEMLLEFTDILGNDYIMVFDSEGEELVCSKDYTGFSLDLDTGEKFVDFHRLLMGIPTVVHEAMKGDVTMLERKIIGVTMNALDDPEKHGALLMALMPEQTAVVSEADGIEQEMTLFKTGEILCFNADAESGKVLESSDVSLVEKTVKECGLTEKSLQDNYMDFGKINGIDYFIVTERHNDHIFYYCDAYNGLLRNNLLYAFCTLILFVGALILISIFLMKGYNAPFYNKWSKISIDQNKLAVAAEISGLEQRHQEIGKAASKLSDYRKKAVKKGNLFLDSIREYTQWSSKLPEEKAGMVLQVGVSLLLVLLQIYFLKGGQDVYGSYDSLFSYLIYGDWMRGVNLFSLCGIALALSIIHLVNALTGWILQVVSGFLSVKGETVCKLVTSLLRYGSIAVALVLSLYYVGVLNGTVIASLGLGSLAISLGAKDVVADVLAGIMIVFDETLRVGDFVEYDGRTGTVMEIGMRYTKLMIPIGNILNVSNQEIRTVLNMSKRYSSCAVNLCILEKEPLEKVEALLISELPAIGAKCDKIRGQVTYQGVLQTGHPADRVVPIPLKVLRVVADCEQKDMFAVQLFLNRELCLLLEREGIQYF